MDATKLLLRLTLNTVAGVLIVPTIIMAAFSGEIATLGVAVAICCAIGSSLSFFSARADKSYFWVYGLTYILIPVLFVCGSWKGSKTTGMQLIWTGMLFIIYTASFVGGFIGSKKAPARDE